MADSQPCPNIDRCPMFAEFTSRQALRVLQIIYCDNEYAACRRYQSMRDGVIPPAGMLPNGRNLDEFTG